MPEPGFNDVSRGAYGTSRAKSARPVFRERLNATPEDVPVDTIMSGASVEEADRLAQRYATRIGDGQTFNATADRLPSGPVRNAAADVRRAVKT